MAGEVSPFQGLLLDALAYPALTHWATALPPHSELSALFHKYNNVSLWLKSPRTYGIVGAREDLDAAFQPVHD
jgi:hypothetical protein